MEVIVVTENRTRHWLQFSLRSFLWMIFCIAVGLAAYQWGLKTGEKQGYEKGEEAWLFKQVGSYWVQRVYPVTDLLERQADSKESQLAANSLVTDIQRNVVPTSWDTNGGAGTILYFNTTGDLVINHDPIVHKRIEQYLKQLRTRSGKSLDRK